MPAHADVYAFTDQQGVLHLSDAPVDTRYQLVLTEPKLTPAPNVTAPAPVVSATPAQEPLQTLIHAAATKHRVEPALVQAVIQVESNFNPRALSPKGAQGLMQLMPATAQRFGVADAFDPRQNIEGGVRYLAELLALFKNDLRLVLAAYNAGENAVLQYGKQVPPYRETQEYVPKVLDIYQRNQSGGARI
jgi:soluble lytic murein transglycosylase-like protein